MIKKMMFVLGLMATTELPAATFEMSRLSTEDLDLLYFDPPQTYLVPHVARSFQNSLVFQRKMFDWTPYEKTTVLLKDFSDYGNAAARSSPNNAIMVDIAPLSRAFETFTASERIYALMNHELAHVATMDVWNERDAGFRRFFVGKPMAIAEHPESILYNYLTTPRVAVPRWYLEGSAVFLETYMSGGLGRAQGAYDEMVFRGMVRDQAHFYGPLGLVSEGIHADFQVGVNAYLYGTRFISYCALAYSPEHVVEWLSRPEGSKGYYASQFKQVFGDSIEHVWQQWINWEHEFQQANLESVGQFPLTKSKPLASTGLGSVSRAFISSDGKSLVGAVRYPGVIAHIGALSLQDGKIRHLTDIKGPMLYRVTSLAYDSAAGKLYYTDDNYSFRDLMVLDEKTGKTRMLLKDARIGELVFNPVDKSLWGVRHLNGYATLVRLPAPYNSWNQIHTFKYGQSLYDMDISADGLMLSTSMGEVNGNQYLRTFRLNDLEGGKVSVEQEFDFGNAVPEGFVFSADGSFLYGSSYYTGVSNIFRFDTRSGEMEAVSNTASGFFRPVVMPDGELVVFEFTGEGFKPVIISPKPIFDLGKIEFLGAKIAEKHPIVRQWQVGSPANVQLDELVTKNDVYAPMRELGIESAYPVVESYKNEVGIGWHFNIADPMQFNRLGITASVTPGGSLPSKERKHLSLDLDLLNWSFGYRHNGADFYDLFGPVERSRKGDAYKIGYHQALIYDKPRQLDLNVEIGHFRGLDTLPEEQNVASNFENLSSVEVELGYSNTRKSLNAIDHEKGHRWDVAASADQAAGEVYGKLRLGYDFGFTLPVNHSSIWFYNAIGKASGNQDSPLSRWYFGSYGNNFVDNGEVKRYRQYMSFPGFEINELSGERFLKSVVEINLPPVRFEEVGSPGFYLTSLRSALFTGFLDLTNQDSDQAGKLRNLGVQIDLNFTIVHRLPMTLSVGYAAGYARGAKVADEWMLSLKVL